MMKKVLISIGALVVAGWLGWISLTAMGAVQEEPTFNKHIDKFDEHKKDNTDRFMEVLKEIQEQRDKIEEKLDDIQEKL